VLNITVGGSYTFQTTSDDGSLLYVDGTQVVNDNGAHPMQTATGTIEFAPGNHLVTVQYAQAGGGAGIIAQYSGADTQGAMIDLGSLPGTITSGGTFNLPNAVSVTAESSIQLLGCGGTMNLPTLAIGGQVLHVVGQGTVAVAGAADLTSTASPTFDVQGGATLAFDGMVSGDAGVTKAGTGTMVLAATNTYNGTTNILGGTLALDGGALPATTAVEIAGGATLDLDGSSQTIASLADAAPAATAGERVLLGSGTLTVGDDTSTTFSGVIAGSGGLTKTGNGTLTLANSETYWGLTTVSAGTLQLGDGSANDSTLAGDILDNAALAVADPGAVTLPGVIGGSGSLSKEGSGVLTLSGENTYSGGTQIAAGAVALVIATPLGSGPVDLAGGTLQFAGSPGFYGAYYNVTNNGNVPNFAGLTPVATRFDATIDFPNDNSGFEPGISGLNTANSGAVWTGLLNIASGGFYNFQTTSDDGSLVYVDGVQVVNDNGSHPMQTASGGLDLASGYHLVTVQYAQAGGGAGIIVQYSGADTEGAMIDLGSLPGTVTVGGTVGLTNALSVTADSSIQLPDSGGTVSLASLAIGSQTLHVVGSGTLAVSGSVALAGPASTTFDVQGDATLSLDGVVSGDAGLTKTGAGGMVLAAANNYSGPTNVTGGTLQALASAGTGGTNALPGDVSLSNATLRLSPSFGPGTPGFFASYYNVTNDGNVPDFSGLTPVATRDDATIDYPDDANGFEPGVSGLNTTDSGAVWTGLLNIASGGSYTFQTTSDDGSLVYVDGQEVVNDDGSHAMQTASGSVELAPGSHLVTIDYAQAGGGAGIIVQYSGADTGNAMIDLGSLAGTVSNPSGDPAAATMNLANNLSLSGASSIDLGLNASFSGTLSVASGSKLTLSTDATAGYGLQQAMCTQAGAVTLAGSLTVNTTTADATILAPVGETLTEVGSLVKTGAGTLTLSAANTYSGDTLISAGALQLGDGTAQAGSVGGNIVNNAALVFANPTDQTFAGTLSGSGSLTKTGSGTLTLSAANSFSGKTQIHAGTVALADPGALAGSTLDYDNLGGTLSFGALTAATLGGLEGGQDLALTNDSGQGVTLTAGGDNASTTYSGVLSGPGTLVKTGNGTLTLGAPGTSAVTIVDPDNRVLAAGVLSVTSPTVMVGMSLTLSAAVADPFGQCQSVAFYLDPDGQTEGDTLLGTATSAGPNGVWSATISTTGWSPSTATGFSPSTENIIAEATFNTATRALPASTTANTPLNLTGDAEWAVISPVPGSPGYSEGTTNDFNYWTTVKDAGAYAGQYRQTLFSGSGDYATYTFSGLAPGNYEIWEQYVAFAGRLDGDVYYPAFPSNVPLQVYDGDAATGHMLQTFTINESSSSNWPDWPFQNPDTQTTFDFGWSGATTTGNSPLTFYANSGTITVVVNCSALDAEAPTLCLIGDPESRTSVASGGSGSPEVSQDFVQYADGGIEPCNCVASAPAGATYSNVNQTLVEGMFGYGREGNLPQLTGDGMLVQAINVPDPCSCPCCNPPTNTPSFTEPGRNYLPMYGTQYTLTESQQADGQYDLMLAAPDGTVWQFAEPADGQAYATGPWEETTLADGQTTVVSWINADGQRTSSPMPGDQAMVVDQYVSPTAAEPEEEDRYTFTTDPVSGAELCSSITYLYWNSTVSNDKGGTGALVYGKQVQYTYYGKMIPMACRATWRPSPPSIPPARFSIPARARTIQAGPATAPTTSATTPAQRSPTACRSASPTGCCGKSCLIPIAAWPPPPTPTIPTTPPPSNSPSSTPCPTAMSTRRLPIPATTTSTSPSTRASFSSTTSTIASPRRPSLASCGPRPSSTLREPTRRPTPTPGPARRSRPAPTAAPTPSTPTTSVKPCWTTCTIPLTRPILTPTPTTNTIPAAT
jgi:autotransporter-associated beta strand protein